ncbi:DASH complex subunit Duo1-domain-containing protein [Dendryphion nanum]|uniref:DASH complex subunit DUO1 n=1 Tax=Dendryphion nanum TaxID=256645 RepID=A0A9P9J2B1_9PLEO|nr:DASH complex subunit Duo1-domain-containing protein [Dendryphion nanum]
MKPPNMEDLTITDSDSDDIFSNPSTKKKLEADSGDAGAGKSRGKESHYTTEEAREESLRHELERVRNVNKVIEGVIESLQKAKDNMNTVSKTVDNASTLLHTWTRILSQTEHNQRLILNRQWQGATQDLADIQNEEVQRQHAMERREAEDYARREATARRVEDERRRAEAAATRGTTRGRGRGGVKSRGASTSTGSSGQYVGVGGQTGRGLTRRGSTGTRSSTSGSGIGRGLRGRGRGPS